MLQRVSQLLKAFHPNVINDTSQCHWLFTNFKTSTGVKQVTLLLIMVMTMGQLNAGNILFVKQNSQGNGSSWTNAFGSVQQALKVAQNGDAIWVAQGTYFTTSGNNRNLSFQIKDGVKLYGGFAGYESSLTQRNINANRTILSGEIGSPSSEDNAYTIIFTRMSAKQPLWMVSSLQAAPLTLSKMVIVRL